MSLIDDLDAEINFVNRRLKLGGAEHPYIPLLLTVPGVGWVLAFTISAEIGDIHRFSTPKKLCGYTGLCPRVNQSGDKDRRGPLTKQARVTCGGRCSKPPCTRCGTPPTPSATSFA